MTIEYIIGNLVNTPHRLIVHGCNAQGVMNSGVAKAIRTKYPEAYEAYYNRYKNKGLKLGEVIFSFSNNKLIANGITQEYYGRDGKQYISYRAINTIMETINDFASETGCSHIAMPLIGAGLGGGSWRTISSIIEAKCENVVPVVYTLDNKIPD